MAGAWTEDRIETLKKLWADGLSCSMIAGRLGGVSRNAVIGKAARLRLSARSETCGDPLRGPPLSVPRIRAARKPPNKPAGHVTRSGSTAKNRQRQHFEPLVGWASTTSLRKEPEPLPQEIGALHDGPVLTMQQLDPNHCRWPVGDPKLPDFGYCGCEAVPGKPYCERHTMVAYRAPEPRDRRTDRIADYVKQRELQPT